MKRALATIMSILMFFTSAVSAAGQYSEGYEKMTGLCEAIKALVNKKEILATKYVGEVSSETWNSSDVYRVEDTAVLYVDKGEDFTVLNITDIHFSDYDIRAFMAFPAISTVKRLVREKKPDLITVSGDIVCGDSTVYSIKRFTDLMDSFGIPWAPVFGNHEDEANCDYNFLADIMMKSPTCLLRKGPADMGTSNYIVNIAERDGDRTKVIHSLIMMDTHRSHLNERQIEWYEWAARGICPVQGSAVESSVIFHIPCAEYQYAYDAAWDAENNRWRDGFEAFGELHEDICCHRDADGNPINNGFFAAVKRVGSTKNILCGHEHMNNFSILYEGVRLSYMLKVGKGSGFQWGFNGGTVITINENGLNLEHAYMAL